MAMLAEENVEKMIVQASGNELMFPTVWELIRELCMTNSAKKYAESLLIFKAVHCKWKER